MVANSHNITLLVHDDNLQVHAAILNLLRLAPREQPLGPSLRQRLLEVDIQQHSRVPENRIFMPLDDVSRIIALHHIALRIRVAEGLDWHREHVCDEAQRLIGELLARGEVHPLIAQRLVELALAREMELHFCASLSELGKRHLWLLNPVFVFIFQESVEVDWWWGWVHLEIGVQSDARLGVEVGACDVADDFFARALRESNVDDGCLAAELGVLDDELAWSLGGAAQEVEVAGESVWLVLVLQGSFEMELCDCEEVSCDNTAVWN